MTLVLRFCDLDLLTSLRVENRDENRFMDRLEEDLRDAWIFPVVWLIGPEFSPTSPSSSASGLCGACLKALPKTMVSKSDARVSLIDQRIQQRKLRSSGYSRCWRRCRV